MSSPSETRASVGIDIGGTFTDLVMLDPRSGERIIEKVLTTPDDPSRGVLIGLSSLLEQIGLPFSGLTHIAHATTLATNTIIEGKGAKIGLLTTDGFRDILEIRTESRYDLYDLDLIMPPPLVAREFREGVRERIDSNGQIVQELDRDHVEELLEAFISKGISDVAVCLIHAYANPVHERQIEEIAADIDVGLRMSLSSELSPEMREYPRTSTTCINAYVRPKIIDYINGLESSLKSRGFRGSLTIMSSAGGVMHPEAAKAAPVALVESGPAAGTRAASYFGNLMSEPQVLAFDMGGTTAKACLIERGKPRLSREFEAARVKRFRRGSGYPIRMPVVELIEIGAGGGSIARVDSLGFLKVGPEGAGARPGPASYGAGGAFATVTDADLLLGYLNPDYFLGGKLSLDSEAATKVVYDNVASILNLSVAEAAWAIFEVVTESMAAAARIHAIEQGYDPRAFTLMAFGGAGPVHAYQVAHRLGIDRVIFPVSAGVASAAGLLVSPAVTHHVATFMRNLDDVEPHDVEATFRSMEAESSKALSRMAIDEYAVERTLEMRYVGQGYEIEVRPPPPHGDDWRCRLRQNFEEEYQRLFGRRLAQHPVEITTCRLVLTGRALHTDICPPIHPPHHVSEGGTRMAYFAETAGFTSTAVYSRESLGPGRQLMGPAIIEEAESTIIVPPGRICTVDPFGNIVMQRMNGDRR